MYIDYDHHAADRKKTFGPLVCCLFLNALLAYFFGLYWLHNPDQYPSTLFNEIYLPLNDTYDRFEGYYLAFSCYTQNNGTITQWNLDDNSYNSNFLISSQIIDQHSQIKSSPVPDYYDINVTQSFTIWFMVGFIL